MLKTPTFSAADGVLVCLHWPRKFFSPCNFFRLFLLGCVLVLCFQLHSFIDNKEKENEPKNEEEENYKEKENEDDEKEHDKEEYYYKQMERMTKKKTK